MDINDIMVMVKHANLSNRDLTILASRILDNTGHPGLVALAERTRDEAHEILLSSTDDIKESCRRSAMEASKAGRIGKVAAIIKYQEIIGCSVGDAKKGVEKWFGKEMEYV